VDHEFCRSAAKCLIPAEKISGEGFGFLSAAETIAGDEEQHPDAGCHFIDEDVLSELGEGMQTVRCVAVSSV
jgi:hypothetical protein